MTGFGRIAVGVGCHRDCSTEEIIELVYASLEKTNVNISDVSVLATAWMKDDAENVMQAAEAMVLPLIVVSQEKCAAMAEFAETISQKVISMYAIPSVAEVAALAAAGKNSKLILPRTKSANATCAIAGSS